MSATQILNKDDYHPMIITSKLTESQRIETVSQPEEQSPV
jgi:hypothetical protein